MTKGKRTVVVKDEIPVEDVEFIDYKKLRNAISEGIVQGFVKILLFMVLLTVLLKVALPFVSQVLGQAFGFPSVFNW